MSKRTSREYNLSMALRSSKQRYHRETNPALALPALPPLEPSPWDDDVPFEPVRKKSTMQLSKRRTV